jgi:hypothetical protein
MVAIIHIKNIKTKTKGKHIKNPNKEGYSNPFNDAFGSKGGKGRKGEKCTYFHKGFHLEYACMKKKDQMAQIIQQNNLGCHIPEGAKKKKTEDQNPKKGNSSHALISINSFPDAWIIYSRSSHPMEEKKSLLFIGCMQRSSYFDGGQLSS